MNNEGESTIFLVKRNGEIFAYYDICPHYGRTRLAWKKDAYLTADGSSVQCSAHGAKFRISDGVCKIGPCMGQRLTSVAINIRDGAVWIEATHRESL